MKTSHPNLFLYIPREPRNDLDKLKEVYRKRQDKVSPDNNEIWLNWIGREKINNHIVGEFQSTIYKDSHADIAYMIDTRYQHQGYAFEVMKKIIEFLIIEMKVEFIEAYIDSRNISSIELVKKLHFKNTKYIKNADNFKGSKSDEYVFTLKI